MRDLECAKILTFLVSEGKIFNMDHFTLFSSQFELTIQSGNEILPIKWGGAQDVNDEAGGPFTVLLFYE